MELIVIFIVVGFIWLLIRSVNSASKEIEADKIREKLMNKNFEEELVKKINTPECREKIINIIKTDLEYIYGYEWKNVFEGRWQTHGMAVCTFNNKEDVILTLLLSKSGLLPSAYVMKRFSIRNFNHANLYENLLIMQCVNRNVKEKRQWDKYNIVFVPEMECEFGRKNAPLKPNYTNPSLGAFKWNFDVSEENAKYIMQLDDAKLITACKEESLGPRSLKSRPYKENYII